MYSSVTNSAYSDLYYDVLNTPIRINNRIALLTSDNPFMLHLLGVRYIETEKDHIPAGYTPLYSSAKDTVVAENKNVLPNVYFTSDTISEKSLTVSIKSNSWKTISRKTIIENTSTDTDSDV